MCRQEQVDVLKVLLLLLPPQDADSLKGISGAKQVELLEEWMEHRAMALLASTEPLAIEVRPSEACGGDRGVFATRPIRKGTLTCLYPGLVSYPHQFEARFAAGKVPERFKCTALYDGTVFDASAALPATPACAVAHLCHHPPKGARPNMLKAAFFWPATFKPNAVNQADAFEPSKFHDLAFTDAKGSRVRGLGYVALRDVAAGEELFVNFRLNPRRKAEWPAWYTPVDDDESAQRWQSNRDADEMK